MKKKYLTLVSIFSITLIVAFIVSCRKNDTPVKGSSPTSIADGSNVPSTIVQELKNWHTITVTGSQNGKVSTQSTTTGTPTTLQPNWDKAQYKQLKDGEEVITVEAPKYTIASKGFSFYRMFVFKEFNNMVLRGEIIEIYSKSDSLSNLQDVIASIRSANISGFNGSIVVYDVNYHYKYSHVYKNGVLTKSGSFVQQNTKSTAKQINSTLRIASTKLLDEGGGGGGDDCLYWYYYEYDQDGNVLYYEYLGTTGNCGGNSENGGITPPSGASSGGESGPDSGPATNCDQSVKHFAINSVGRVTTFSNSCSFQPDSVFIDTTTKKKSPCAIDLVVDNLEECGVYSNLIAPFTTSSTRPSITWQIGPLVWNGTNYISGDGSAYETGHTVVDPLSGIGESQIITLNQSMISHSSQLMVAATAIHETLHAYIHYQMAISKDSVLQGYVDTASNWCIDLDHWYNMVLLPPNYNDHSEMLTTYFCQAVDCLQQWDNYQHSEKEYMEAMLYGLDDIENYATTQEKSDLAFMYQETMTMNNITSSDLQSFYQAQVVSASTNTKLPTSGCH